MPKAHTAAQDKKGLFREAWLELAPHPRPRLVEELRFAAPARQFRFDFAWKAPRGCPIAGIGIEIDGGQYMVRRIKQGRFAGLTIPVGRHNKDSDREKVNLAAVRRWLVLRYTPQMLRKDPGAVVAEVFITISGVKEAYRVVKA